MNARMVDFQWRKLSSQRRLILLLVPAVASFTQAARAAADVLLLSPLPIAIAVIFGSTLALLQEEHQAGGPGSDAQYLLTRTGTRAELVMSRWVVYASVGLALAVLFAMNAIFWGKLSPHAQAQLLPQDVHILEDAGLVLSSQATSQPAARSVFVTVSLPWLAAPLLVLSLLAFLLGSVSVGVFGPPRVPWTWRRLLDPEYCAGFLPYAATMGFLLLPGLTGSLGRRNLRVFAMLYTHAWLCIAIGLALIAMYAWWSLRVWKRANL